MAKHRLPLLACLLAAVLGASAFAAVALAEAELTRTADNWIVACEQTEAGGRQCGLRNDEGGLPALEQSRLLSLTLHAGSNEAEGLVRIADLELPPRLDVELTFGDRKLAVEGVGRHGRLVARFTLPRSKLAELASADAIRVRLADPQSKLRELAFPTAGLKDALKIAEDRL